MPYHYRARSARPEWPLGPHRSERLALRVFLPVIAIASPSVLQAQNQAPAAVEVPAVSVVEVGLTPDQEIQQDGAAEEGYKAESIASGGALGARKQLDTPYPVNVVTRDLIENVQV